MKQILLAVFVVVLVAGCNHPKPKLDVCGVTKIEISYPQGGTVITDSVIIKELSDAMLKGKPDNGVYDTAKNILITAYKGENIAWRMSAGSPFVTVSGQQFRCPEFHAALQKLITKSKESTQPKLDGRGSSLHGPALPETPLRELLARVRSAEADVHQGQDFALQKAAVAKAALEVLSRRPLQEFNNDKTDFCQSFQRVDVRDGVFVVTGHGYTWKIRPVIVEGCGCIKEVTVEASPICVE